MLQFVVILFCSTIFLVVYAETNLVKTLSGWVEGRSELTFLKGHTYYAYQGIPYGESTAGEMRFKVCNLVFFIIIFLISKGVFFYKYYICLSM